MLPGPGNAIMTVVCIIGSGLAAGLTQGLLSIDSLELKVKMRSGTEEEKFHASRVLSIVQNHHLLLVSLLLFNAAANEALPLFLDAMVPSWVALILSVTLVMLCGDIIPSAIFTGPNQLRIASFLAPFVRIILVLFWPVSYPISVLLDAIVGAEDPVTLLNRKEISALIRIQQEEGKKQGLSAKNIVHDSEIAIIEQALSLRDLTVSAVMMTSLFSLSMDDRLDVKTLSRVFYSGHSRVPIYDLDVNNIVGLLYVKDLLFIDGDDDILVRNFMTLFGRPVQYVSPNDKIQDILLQFRKTHCHLAIVYEIDDERKQFDKSKIKGIITMENIVSKLIGGSIDLVQEEEYERLRRNTRNIDFANLKTISEPNRNDMLSNEEVQQIVGFLANNVPQIASIFGEENIQDIEALVRSSHVLKYSAPSSSSSMKRMNPINTGSSLSGRISTASTSLTSSSFSSTSAASGSGSGSGSTVGSNFLYRKGKLSNVCTLILSGKVAVTAGIEQFQVEMGPWSILGVNLFSEPDGVYVPDFTAEIISTELRALRILRPQALMEARKVGLSQSQPLLLALCDRHDGKILAHASLSKLVSLHVIRTYFNDIIDFEIGVKHSFYRENLLISFLSNSLHHFYVVVATVSFPISRSFSILDQMVNVSLPYLSLSLSNNDILSDMFEKIAKSP